MFTAFDTYLEALASNHPDIQHTPEEPAYFHSVSHLHNEYSGTRRKPDGPYMVYVAGSYGLGNSHDNPLKGERHEVWILKKGNHAEPKKLLGIFDECEAAISNLLGRMNADREKEVAAALFFDLLNARVEQVGPISGELYGASVILPRSTEFIPTYDPDAWLDA